MIDDANELKIEVAKRLGWIEESSWQLIGRVKHNYRWRNTVTGERLFDLDDYPRDRNTQPQMLAAMSLTQRRDLCRLAIHDDGESIDIQDCVICLSLPQENFCRLWLRVMKGE